MKWVKEMSIKINGKSLLLAVLLLGTIAFISGCSRGGGDTVLAEVNDTEITADKAEFQQLIGLLHLELVRTEGQAEMDEETLEYMSEFWDEQEVQVRNMNHTLTKVIRTLAMAKLAEEKGYVMGEEAVEEQADLFYGQYESEPAALALIEEYGTELFQEQLYDYTEEWLLARIVYADVLEEVQSERPGMEGEELEHIASQQYEELLVSQMETLDVKIFPGQ
ncbi:hypothetical protein [Evansella clarkii]|uniref:hypothetical protein n=1 Tax=Evansella clarkii TaxID=79879 RepID=UPI001ADD0594|nr:hypothetical protein [Evansella clarkii]